MSASSPVYSPVSGTVTAVNRALDDDPGIISTSPEQKGWLYKLDNIDPAEIDELKEAHELMSEEEYAEYLETL